MKKAMMVMLMLFIAVVILTSCNKNVCPAYVVEDETIKVENNS